MNLVWSDLVPYAPAITTLNNKGPTDGRWGKRSPFGPVFSADESLFPMSLLLSLAANHGACRGETVDHLDRSSPGACPRSPIGWRPSGEPHLSLSLAQSTQRARSQRFLVCLFYQQARQRRGEEKGAVPSATHHDKGGADAEKGLEHQGHSAVQLALTEQPRLHHPRGHCQIEGVVELLIGH